MPDKHELFRRSVYGMAGGSSNHAEITVSLTLACGNALGVKGPCRCVGENRWLVIQPSNDPNSRLGTYYNSAVIFEVPSPGISAFDRSDKVDDYKIVPTLRDYVLIQSEKPRVEVFSRLDDGRRAQRVPRRKRSEPHIHRY